jgi:hypothetical protein
MWPLVFTRIIIGLLIFELTSAGLFTLNKSYPLAALCVPLIFLTVAYKFMMDKAYQKSTQFLPLNLLAEKLGPMTTIALECDPLQTRDISSSPSTMDDINVHPLSNVKKEPTPAAAHTTGESSTVAVKKNRKRRTVLDEDDYVADPRKFTDFKEPPMTLLNGILNTGMKQYGHPALLGVLPQLWLPVKAGYEDRGIVRNIIASNDSSSASFTSSSSASTTSLLKKQHLQATPGKNEINSFAFVYTKSFVGAGADESQPLLQQRDIPSRGINNIDTTNIPTKRRKRSRKAVEQEEGGQTDDEEEEDNVGTYYHHPERRHSRNLLSRSYGATCSSAPK